ncbi:MAG TPA: peptide-methionine (S)-S-oxide reductase MsrA [Polyangia bacterium]|nr:peptide-methionine (S)-S-oxide reductase MsrA [Polyangia bacterium]
MKLPRPITGGARALLSVVGLLGAAGCANGRAQTASETTVAMASETTNADAAITATTTTTTTNNATNTRTETALLAGGCFWGMQEILRGIPGVIYTEVGYVDATGKEAAGNAESVKIVFDPVRLTYATLLEKWFFSMHDPTTPNRQGNDAGPQYRSAIFTLSDEQRRVAETVRARVNSSGKWKRPLVTQIVTAGSFVRAGESHQDYLQKNPGGYTCHFLRY